MKIKIVSILVTLCLVFYILVSPLLTFAEQKTFAGGGYASPVYDYVDFERKVEDEYTFDGGIASYTYTANNLACGAVAGTVVLGYYDRVYPDLIASFVPTSTFNGSSFYIRGNATIDKVTSELITLMNGAKGTTVSGFKTGLTGYVNNKGLKTSFGSTMDTFLVFSSFSFEKYKKEIVEGRPVVLCLGSHHQSYVSTNAKRDTQSYMYSTNNHMMVGYGYKVIRYYRTENVSVWSPVWYNLLRFETVKQEVNFRTDTFLLAETGQESATYLNINKSLNIQDAFSVKIYK